jgi:hypothetical protein
MTQPHEKLITVQDVYNVVTEHMNALDNLWPDHDMHGPRKVHIVELIDAIKLRLIQCAERNANRHETPFEKAAKKVTGSTAVIAPREEPSREVVSTGKSAMQLAHEEAKARMRGQK